MKRSLQSSESRHQIQLSKPERCDLQKLHRGCMSSKIKDRCRCILLRDNGYPLEQLKMSYDQLKFEK